MDKRISLDPATERAVHDLVESGAYKSREAVVTDGVRLIRERQAFLARFDAEIMKGVGETEAGHSVDIKDVGTRLKAKYRAMTTKAA